MSSLFEVVKYLAKYARVKLEMTAEFLIKSAFILVFGCQNLPKIETSDSDDDDDDDDEEDDNNKIKNKIKISRNKSKK